MSAITNKNLIAYCLLAFCLAFIGLPIYIYIPNYYAHNFGIDLKIIALILLITRLFDTIQDPLFGIISDKFSHLKKKIILFFSPILGLSFLFLFYPLQEQFITLWLALFLILTYSTYSIIYINYQSYAIDFSDDYHFKTKIIAYREVAFILGIISAASVPALLFLRYDEVTSFGLIGLCYTILITLFALIFYFKSPQNTSTHHHQFNLRKLFHLDVLRKYFTIFFLNAIASSIPAALILFFVDEVLHVKKLAGIFLLLYFVGLMIGVFVWTKISQILNSKDKSWLISIISTAFIFIWCYFLQEGDVIEYAAICIFSGIAFGGDFALGFSILTDIIQKHHLQNNQTTIFGICNFIIKIALTIASSALIYIIGTLEHDLTTKVAFISFAYAILPIIFRLVAGFKLYQLSHKL